ncbi:Core histone macro-H2A.1-like [Oopsacas minuta]|uniref:Histone H2A n=1 Tax=Oopsacas minuta TaxID=111878 RepID=A0AAV7JDS2_9METZ|nr:Core histone macro-H2A.1-like [Oopsacas minuta]
MPAPPNLISRRRKSARAGLIFPVPRIGKNFKNCTVKLRPRVKAMVYLTAVLEYLVAELLDAAGQVTKQLKRSMITPSFIALAIFLDADYHKLLRGVIIPSVSNPCAYSSSRRS